jgi:hypothetical protein
MGNKPGHSDHEEVSSGVTRTSRRGIGGGGHAGASDHTGAAEDAEELVAEVPPPMQPIASVNLAAASAIAEDGSKKVNLLNICG